MFDFFFALFGGFYWSTKVSYEIAAQRKLERETKERLERRAIQIKEWIAKTSNRHKEEELSLIARNGWFEEPYYTEIWDAATDLEWENVKENIEWLRSGKLRWDGFYYFRLLVLMVNRGLLPFSISTSGFPYTIGADEWSRTLFMWTPQYPCDERRTHYDLMIWTTKKLREHGFDVYPVAQTTLGIPEYSYLDESNYKNTHYLWDAMVDEAIVIQGQPNKKLYVNEETEISKGE